MPTNYQRRGERLKRLAYELETLATNASADGLDTRLRKAAAHAREAADAYLDRANGRD